MRVAARNSAMICAARRYDNALMLPRKCSRLLMVTCLSIAHFENCIPGEPPCEGTESSCRITTGLYDSCATP